MTETKGDAKISVQFEPVVAAVGSKFVLIKGQFKMCFTTTLGPMQLKAFKLTFTTSAAEAMVNVASNQNDMESE